MSSESPQDAFTNTLAAHWRQPHRWRRAATGLVLSLLTPGLGHVYGGRLARGVTAYLGLLFVGVTNAVGQVFFRYGLLIFGAAFLISLLLIHADAFRLCLEPVSSCTFAVRRSPAFYVVAVLLNLALLSLLSSPPGHSTISSMVHKVTGRGLYRVPTASMQPGLLVGDFVVVDFLAHGNEALKRGDIVVYAQEGSLYAKRILALGGETIEGRGGRILVDGLILEDPWKFRGGPIIPEGLSQDFGPISVPGESIFVLGDNRDRSRDSRSFGPVPLRQLRGRLLFVAWSSRWGRLGLRLDSTPKISAQGPHSEGS